MKNFKTNFINRLSKYANYREILKFIECQEAEVANYLYYLYANAPTVDIFNVDKKVFLDYAEAGAVLRKNECKNMDEDIFMQNVLFHRVGTEIIKPCRNYFYEKLSPYMKDDAIENIKMINYFCGDEVIYTTTDIRTLDAMTVYKSGFGRCGEESVFAVNVFRSLGIPARQVYSVYWAHCDDNHAWVEVYVDGEWKYLGACEPEEVLNKGWFNAASARAMFICSREYRDGNIYRINQSARYMYVVDFKVRILYKNKPLSDICVDLQIPNFAGFVTLISLKTDKNGEINVETGRGHVMLKIDDYDVHIPVHTYKENGRNINIEDYFTDFDIWKEMKWEAPVPSDRNYIKSKAPRRSRYKEKEFVNKKNKDLIIKSGMEKVWNILSEKDKRDITYEIVADAFSVSKIEEIDDEIYLNYVVNPRVDFENLSASRQLSRSMFADEKDIEKFFGNIDIVDDEMIFETVNVLKYKISNLHSLNIAKVNAYRSLGIPAKLENGLIFIYKEGEFIAGNDKDGIKIDINGENGDYMKTYSISPKSRKYIPITKESFESSGIVNKGKNLIVTSKRLPNGNQAVAYKYMDINENNRSLNLKFMRYNIEDILSNILINEDIRDIIPFEQGVIIWAKENSEPTRHILGEILEDREVFERINILIMFSDIYAGDDNVIEQIKRLGNVIIIDNLGERLQEVFGRGLFVNHETLPILANMENKHINYAFSGYSVGNIGILKDIINR